jgi:hypothetical protein
MTDTWQRDIDMQLQQFQPNNQQNNGQQRRATFNADPRVSKYISINNIM